MLNTFKANGGRKTMIKRAPFKPKKQKNRPKSQFVRWSLEEEICLRDCVIHNYKKGRTISWKAVLEMMPEKYVSRTPKKLRNKWRKLLFREGFIPKKHFEKLAKGKKIPQPPGVRYDDDTIKMEPGVGYGLHNENDGVKDGEGKGGDKTLKKETAAKEIAESTFSGQNGNWPFHDSLIEKWLDYIKKGFLEKKAKKCKKIDQFFSRALVGPKRPKLKIDRAALALSIYSLSAPNNKVGAEVKGELSKSEFSADNADLFFRDPGDIERKKFNFLSSSYEPSLTLPANLYSMPNYCRLFSPFRFGSLASKRVPRIEIGRYKGYDRMSNMQLESLFYTYKRNLNYKRLKIKEYSLLVQKQRERYKEVSRDCDALKAEIDRLSAAMARKSASFDKIVKRLQFVQIEFRRLNRLANEGALGQAGLAA